MTLKIGKYRHFKGSVYRVLLLARHSETDEELVIYHPLNTPNDVWVRPLNMFDETIVRHGVSLKRFVFVEN